ncbi:MAG: cytochrome P450 [Hyphomonadaceae bacterium]|nr:cytochrome P450 [Hyphomonadaceae bacterium]
MPLDTTIERPKHVKPDQVFDLDIFLDKDLLQDPHKGYRALQQKAPEIFYTCRNGGHWVVMRFDTIASILRDAEHFSSKELTIPKSNSDNVMLPLNLDPPEHAGYRAALMKHVNRKFVDALEPELRKRANELIDEVIAAGECDFSERLGAAFPVSVFMDFMAMPRERFDEFRGIVHEYFSPISNARYLELQSTIISVIREMIAARRATPGEDLLSKLMEESVRGRPLTDAEVESYGFLLFLGGLDTVANALTFSFRHLAEDAPLQARLVADPSRIPDFVEESLRCFGVVHQTRIVKKDVDIDGVHMREGDMVSCALPAAGLDDRKNPDPERFDIDRPRREHLVFSTGAHTCIGNVLARAEMKVFTEEWLKRIPSFRIPETGRLVWRAGQVMSLQSLPLEWTRGGK